MEGSSNSSAYWSEVGHWSLLMMWLLLHDGCRSLACHGIRLGDNGT
ncbi:hypothetical protein LX90_008546 [Lentzea flava]|nr:hypothetical protein [Lentzea flava]